MLKHFFVCEIVDSNTKVIVFKRLKERKLYFLLSAVYKVYFCLAALLNNAKHSYKVGFK